ncbi:MAG: VPLPA-CTERM sorting domain-containing protein [Deltaproteobacteria bacterium]|nr:VPLPA-CTERM sorting domain-containing protein [Deltaproteobacteria bacterium]
MKKISILVLVLMLTAGFNASAGAATALTNGGFENGLSGWEYTNVSVDTSWAGIYPVEGDFQAVLSLFGFSPSSLGQGIGETDYLTISFNYNLWAFAPFGSEAGDNLVVSLIGNNFTKEILNTNITAKPSRFPEILDWTHFTETITLESDEYPADLSLYFKLDNFKDTNQLTVAYIDNIIIDDLNLHHAPVPASLLLLGSGIAALTGISFRRKNY